MKKINYPLLCYPLGSQTYLGFLVGTEYKHIAPDVEALRMQLTRYIQRQYKRYDDYWYFDIESPRLKTIKVQVQPAYREDYSSYPVGDPLLIPVPVIYGKTEEGYYECYLPLYNRRFTYYEEHQLHTLVEHLAKRILNNMDPSDLHKQVQYPKPTLDFVSLKVNEMRGFQERNRAWNDPDLTAQQKQLLDRLCTRYPYTKATRKQIMLFPDAAWERQEEVSKVEAFLGRRNNVIVLGESGMGKSAVIRQAIRNDLNQARRKRQLRTYWQFSGEQLTASAKYLGEWQEQAEALVLSVRQAQGTLWVMDLVNLMNSGGERAEDSLAAFMMPFLADETLHIIAELTPSSFQVLKRRLPRFAALFKVVQLEKLPARAVMSILNEATRHAAQQLKVTVTPEVIPMIYRLTERYYPYSRFPGKGLKLLGKCFDHLQHQPEKPLDANAVIEQVVVDTGMPRMLIDDQMDLEVQELRNYFDSRIIGQPQVIDYFEQVVEIFKAGLNDAGKPVATILMSGPTGVGKTASAKALADYFYGSGQRKHGLVRLDMSEFQHPMQLNRLIGEGRKPGSLVTAIRERPFAVLLLDEIEKAHPQVFDLLLSILDEGRLTDQFGRLTSFNNCIIIMTSNLGSSGQRPVGLGKLDLQQQFDSAIRQFFRPEFLNRLDHIIPFRPLSQEDIHAITRLELERLAKREGLEKRDMTLRYTDALVDHIAEIGFDPKYGARPLQRTVERWVASALAQWLIAHPQRQGLDLILDYNGRVQIRAKARTRKSR